MGKASARYLEIDPTSMPVLTALRQLVGHVKSCRSDHADCDVVQAAERLVLEVDDARERLRALLPPEQAVNSRLAGPANVASLPTLARMGATAGGP